MTEPQYHYIPTNLLPFKKRIKFTVIKKSTLNVENANILWWHGGVIALWYYSSDQSFPVKFRYLAGIVCHWCADKKKPNGS